MTQNPVLCVKMNYKHRKDAPVMTDMNHDHSDSSHGDSHGREHNEFGTITCKRTGETIIHSGKDRKCRCIPGFCALHSLEPRERDGSRDHDPREPRDSE